MHGGRIFFSCNDAEKWAQQFLGFLGGGENLIPFPGSNSPPAGTDTSPLPPAPEAEAPQTPDEVPDAV